MTGSLPATQVRASSPSYFGARYYVSSLGSFVTPDWSDSPALAPYADLAQPQSLNPYSYVLNSPATSVDPDGHFGGGDCAGQYPCMVRAPMLGGPVIFFMPEQLLQLGDFLKDTARWVAAHPGQAAAAVARVALGAVTDGATEGVEAGIEEAGIETATEGAEAGEAGEATDGIEDWFGPVRDTTRAGAGERNIAIGLTRGEFETRLEAEGWARSERPWGAQFTKDGAKYDVYTRSSTEGPGAQYTPAGAKKLTLKITLAGGGN